MHTGVHEGLCMSVCARTLARARVHYFRPGRGEGVRCPPLGFSGSGEEGYIFDGHTPPKESCSHLANVLPTSTAQVVVKSPILQAALYLPLQLVLACAAVYGLQHTSQSGHKI